MNIPDDLVASWRSAFASTSVGWDFSAVGDHLVEQQPPWDFDGLSIDALAATDSAVDMGTG
ncbi:MAG: methyltransferase type 11, partial [Terracoccus sp.]